MEEAQYDYSRLTRIPLIRFDNDAKECYDRITPNMASICCQRLGLHKNLAIMNGKVLRNTRYHLKLPHGLSTTSYQHTPPLQPVYGTGQGAGNSPAVWTCISSVLFDCHDDHAHGAFFESSDTSASVRIGMAGYVDDSTISINTGNQDVPSLLKKAQHDAQLWFDLLWNSGGNLSLSKCSFHFIAYNFDSSGEPFFRDHILPYSHRLELRSYDRNATVNIKCLGSRKSHRTLGCHKSPDGGQTTQLEVLETKCMHYATVVAHSRLKQHEARTFYDSIFLPSVGYFLPTCHFAYDNLHDLQSKANAEIFAATGYNRHFSHAIMFAPKQIGGGGYYHLYDLLIYKGLAK